ncbi:DoxX family membrane protein [Saccharothrix texasensis]|uniref:Putative membrane protein YkgB n=1 Tax=Saccharothrix texasensis TaxID=103734 RepID=A0A3N1GY22_9PSEU|nr:DoxX family membrane protein [Saccharothrix texasensis]ROP35069.1 putative membrane protein YkgB [Saccharothrix texasensis]
MTARAVALLRGSLGLVFVWFGALKVADVTPVADLVARTVPWLDRNLLLASLGSAEIVLGATLWLGRRLRWVAAVALVHLLGTFLVLVVQPQAAFQAGNPLLLTTEGEFVVKNLVLITACLVLMSADRQRRAGHPLDIGDDHNEVEHAIREPHTGGRDDRGAGEVDAVDTPSPAAARPQAIAPVPGSTGPARRAQADRYSEIGPKGAVAGAAPTTD